MKKWMCWLLAAAMLLGMTGCKKNTKPETVPTESETTMATETEPEVLEIPYEGEEDSRPYLGVTLEFQTELSKEDAQAQAIVTAAAYFEASTGAVVNVRWKENVGEVSQMDIFEVGGAMLASDYLEYALDLTEMAQTAGYENWSHAAIRQQVISRCGYLAGIASVPHLTALYYDADAFESCGIQTMPVTWGDFLTLCKTLTLNGRTPLAMDGDFSNVATELHLERALGRENLLTLITGGWAATEEAVFAAEQISFLATEGYLAGGAPGVYPEGYKRLASGGAVMMASSDKLCQLMEADGGMEVRWGVCPWPGDGTGTGTAVDEQVLVINKNTENAQAAFDFVRLLTSGEFDQLRADLRRGIPADPNNISPIVGAVETLQKASSESFGLLDINFNDIYTQLWQGTYHTGGAFFRALG